MIDLRQLDDGRWVVTQDGRAVSGPWRRDEDALESAALHARDEQRRDAWRAIAQRGAA